MLGDVNTPARLLGFDALAAAGGGLARAALWSGAWRATWPSFVPIPLYEIDHVWVSRSWNVQRASFFSCWGSDHRGQLVEMQPAW
jgi:endonuclease/exonuclease/phosphatase (EEP) superfamily protein YafD